MKVVITLVAGMFPIMMTSGQVQSSAYDLTLKTLLSHSVPEVSVAQVKAMKDVILLDARESNEYKVSHIKNAGHVGYDQFDIDNLKSINKSKKIVVYCSVGYRSEKISEKLQQAGFTDVSNLYGGIFEWVNQGNAVVDDDGNPTKKIHAYNKTWGIWLNQGEKVYE